MFISSPSSSLSLPGNFHAPPSSLQHRQTTTVRALIAGVVIGLVIGFSIFHTSSSSSSSFASFASSSSNKAPNNDAAAYSLDTQGVNRFAALEHLVVVTGHAVYMAGDFAASAKDESWWLASYQKGNGQLDAFRAHIARGVALSRYRSLAVVTVSKRSCFHRCPRVYNALLSFAFSPLISWCFR
jgi:hypothetical protein